VADEMLVSHLGLQLEEPRFSPHLRFLVEGPSRQHYLVPERQLELLAGWLSAHRTTRGLLVAVECPRHIGTCRDLAILDRHPIQDNSPAELMDWFILIPGDLRRVP
jgi:hypothetical protein